MRWPAFIRRGDPAPPDPISRPVSILTAVSFDPGREVAGIAGTFRGGRIICADICVAKDLCSAHVLALLRQIEITSQPNAGPAVLYTDSELVLPCLAGEAEASSPESAILLSELRGWLDAYGPKITIQNASREGTKSAFIAARQARKAWLAGLKGGGVTWSRSGLPAEAVA